MQFGLTNINIFFKGWWTLFIIIPCFIELFKQREKTGNVIGLIIGVTLLLCCQDILDFSLIWKLALPTILVVIGVSFIFKDTMNKKINDEIVKLNKTKENEYCSTFSSQKVRFDGEKFNGTDVTAVFGGVDIDLRSAIIENDVVINATAVFGGIDIFVPGNTKVKIKSSSIFGGVDDKNIRQIDGENVHTIYINATCIFGGVEVK